MKGYKLSGATVQSFDTMKKLEPIFLRVLQNCLTNL